MVDYSKNEFRLARRATGTTPPPNIQTLGQCGTGNSGLGATVIGLIVGLVVVAIIAAVLAFFALKWRPRQMRDDGPIKELQRNSQ